MDPKNFVVILLAFCTTLLLGSGISIVLGVTAVDVCTEAFCYIIRDYIIFYRTIFFTFGAILAIIAFFGFIGLMLKSKKILLLYARLLMLVLVAVLMILFAGIWAKGPVQLRSNLFNAIKTYPHSCRTITSVDNLQRRFKCCGIDKPEDWSYVFNKQALEPPSSCCSMFLGNQTLKQDNEDECLTTYSKGCLCPLRQLYWRFFNVVALLATVIALKSTVAIVCAHKLITTDDNSPTYVFSQQNLITASAIDPINIVYPSDENLIKKETSSTVV